MSQIDTELWAKAERLASQNYDIVISKDVLSDGREIYLVKNPELRGCTAQADTLNEALKELKLARTNYIYFKLLDGRPINPPKGRVTVGTGGLELTQSTLKWLQNDEKHDSMTQPNSSERPANVRVVAGDLVQKP